MPKRICANCGQTQGPFTLIYKVPGIPWDHDVPSLRVCGPVELEKETKKLIGRVAACNERRRKQEIAMYGDANNPYA